MLIIRGCALHQADRAEKEKKPNFIFILADDLGYGDLGVYGQKEIKTPNLDNMAEQGIRFTQYYAGSTVCAPSRSVLLTGLHTGRTPIRGNRRISLESEEPLPDSSETVIALLKDAGYNTGVFGKWGLGGPGTTGSPINQGVDEFYGKLSHRHAHFYYPEFLYRGEERERLPGNCVVDDPPYPGAGLNITKETYSHDAIMDEALSYIKRQNNEEAPYFLYLPLGIPHAELLVPDEALSVYLDDDGNSIFEETPHPEGQHYGPQPFPTAAYAAMVTKMDHDIGRLFELLDELEMEENTLVFFSSDNGSHAEGGYHPENLNSSGPLRGYKRDLYEGGIRVPAIARWTGTIEGDRISDHIAGFQDILPTFCELAGVEAPSDIDGISMVRELSNKDGQPEHDYLYWEFHEQGGIQGVRKGKWKSVRKGVREDRNAPVELYNIEEDIGEQNDVARLYPEIVKEMEDIMDKAHVPSESFPL